jgi:tetratricopeptide (TPR) repeat protein
MTVEKKQDLIASNIRDGENHRLQGLLAQSLQCFNDAAQTIERSPRRDSDSRMPWLLAHRGSVLSELGQFEKARADLEQALKLKPRYAWAQAHLAESYRLEVLGHISVPLKSRMPIHDEGALYMTLEEKALPGFTAALELGATPWVHAHAGATHTTAFWLARRLGKEADVLQRHFDAGDAHFREACRMDPVYAWAFAFHAYLLMIRKEGLEDIHNASLKLERGLLFDTVQSPDFRRTLSEVYSYGGRYRDSALVASQLIANDNRDFAAHYFYALSLGKDPEMPVEADYVIERSLSVLKNTRSLIHTFIAGLEVLKAERLHRRGVHLKTSHFEAFHEHLKHLHESRDMESLVVLENDPGFEFLQQSPNNDSDAHAAAIEAYERVLSGLNTVRPPLPKRK